MQNAFSNPFVISKHDPCAGTTMRQGMKRHSWVSCYCLQCCSVCAIGRSAWNGEVKHNGRCMQCIDCGCKGRRRPQIPSHRQRRESCCGFHVLWAKKECRGVSGLDCNEQLSYACQLPTANLRPTTSEAAWADATWVATHQQSHAHLRTDGTRWRSGHRRPGRPAADVA